MLKDAKKAFAESLKGMISKKALNHITIKDITEDCGVSRQAFYYHFSDIYELVEWIFLEETEKAIANNRDIRTWQQGYCNVLQWIRDNEIFVSSVYRSMNRDSLETFIYEVLYNAMYPVIKKQADGKNIKDKDIEFIARFYSLAVAAVGLYWVRTGMKEDPKEIADKVGTLAKGEFAKALE